MSLIRAIRRRKLTAGALTLLIAASVLALAWKSDELGSRTGSGPEPNCTEPWSECSPDAQWLRQVLAKAGYPDAGPGTGSALVIPSENPSSQQFFWAVLPVGPLDREEYSPYNELPRVDDTPIYSDGVRLVWQAQGRNVYFEPLSLKPPPDGELVTKLVRFTKVVPAPAPEPTAAEVRRPECAKSRRLIAPRSSCAVMRV